MEYIEKIVLSVPALVVGSKINFEFMQNVNKR